MIPNLDPRRISSLIEYLSEGLRQARSDRAELEDDWKRFAALYRARPEDGENTFPFKGAAKLKIPVAATDVDTTVSGLMGSIFAAPNLWSCEGLRPDWLEFAARLEEFLEWAQEQELHMYATVADWITELVKMGTGVLKQRYRREEKLMWEWRELGPGQTIQQMVRRIATNRPDVKRTPLANFYVPGTVLELQDSPWVGERLEMTWNVLQTRVQQGIYRADAISKIGASWTRQFNQPHSQYTEYQTFQEELDKFTPSLNDKFEVFEFWTNFDLLGIGEPQALVCTIHEPSNTYLRADFNPFFHQEFPYSVARFLRQEGRFYGIGLCEMLEQIQEEVSTMHRQRIDSGTVRNAAVYKARRGSGVKTDTPIYPSAIILVENMDDLAPMNMGYESQSTVAEEELLINYARQRSSVSDYQRGGAGTPAISYSTATTVVEMLRQGRLRLDQVLRDIQQALGETGQRVVELYQQYDQAGKPYTVMGDKDGAIVQQVLRFPLDTIRTGVAIKVTATNTQLNKETKIRTDQIIFGLVTQFYQQLFQGMAIVVNPQVPPPLRMLAFQMVQGGLVLARRILDAYGTQDLDLIIPDINALTQLSAQFGQITGTQPFGNPGGPGAPINGGGAGLPGGYAQSPGLAALPAITGGTVAAGNQLAPV